MRDGQLGFGFENEETGSSISSKHSFASWAKSEGFFATEERARRFLDALIDELVEDLCEYQKAIIPGVVVLEVDELLRRRGSWAHERREVFEKELVATPIPALRGRITRQENRTKDKKEKT